MHLLLAGIIGISTYLKVDKREYTKYALTVFYVIILNLLYEYLCQDKLLWIYIPDSPLQIQTITTLIYTFIILPCITLLYLSHYPFEKAKKVQGFYIFKWVILSCLFESIFLYFGRITLTNGYQSWMEPLFYLMMYLMIRLHFTRPYLTYGLSVIIIITLLNIYSIPLK